MARCPGQDTQYWSLDDIYEIPCPKCQAAVEFFKTDLLQTCPKCRHRFKNPRLDLGCAEWCPHGEECLELLAGGAGLSAAAEGPLIGRLTRAMKAQFGADHKRVLHALQVLAHAKEILQTEGGDPRIVFAAALLHDIGIQEAERKHGSPAGKYQEIEGPPIARRIMEEMGLDEATIEPVCEIIAHHHRGGLDSPEFRIIWDADWMVNFPHEFPERTPEEISNLIERIFKTKAGHKKACEQFIKPQAE